MRVREKLSPRNRAAQITFSYVKLETGTLDVPVFFCAPLAR
ncbi:hypothetical protein J2T57_000391 [Natronocella acetinitrilica]|uniref:Uncharacterized protein n=1 Tax=Natronocella acetinitrilica TaxID=414046 RepID=A0AAE3G0Q8_9GAMM|nr:hypothetical protein [Natronocella acetinitrilica]